MWSLRGISREFSRGNYKGNYRRFSRGFISDVLYILYIGGKPSHPFFTCTLGVYLLDSGGYPKVAEGYNTLVVVNRSSKKVVYVESMHSLGFRVHQNICASMVCIETYVHPLDASGGGDGL